MNNNMNSETAKLRHGTTDDMNTNVDGTKERQGLFDDASYYSLSNILVQHLCMGEATTETTMCVSGLPRQNLNFTKSQARDPRGVKSVVYSPEQNTL